MITAITLRFNYRPPHAPLNELGTKPLVALYRHYNQRRMLGVGAKFFRCRVKEAVQKTAFCIAGMFTYSEARNQVIPLFAYIHSIL